MSVSNEAIVLVHGIYMNGMDMFLLKQRLKHAGYPVYQFSYHSLQSTPAENAMDLHAFTERIQPGVIHYVCHSLGGLVIRHLFNLYPEQKPGRIVTLGTPHVHSSAAISLQQFSPGKLLLGQSTRQGLVGNVPSLPQERELGSIAGTLRMGFGLLIPGIPKPNDGTVAVSETKLEGMKDHIILPVSHFGMLLSRSVVRQIIHFLKHGVFEH